MSSTSPYDVAVIGGGTAGVVAAIQAARAGARTLLIEKTGLLGGTMTNGGIDRPGLFWAWGKKIIGGIGWELADAAAREAGAPLPDIVRPDQPFHMHQPKVPRQYYAMICDEKVVESGAEILFHAMPAAIAREDDRWRITLCRKEGLGDVIAKVLIDCTGDANAVSLAGGPVETPEEMQPGTLVFQTSGYDADALDLDAIRHAYDKALAEGRFNHHDFGWGGDRIVRFLHKYGHNAIHTELFDAATSAGKSAMEVDGRRKVLGILRWLRTLPGLQNIKLEWICPEAGVRETRVIRGKTRVTVEDYESGRVWSDALCYSFYAIDIHTNKEGHGIDGRGLKEGIVPTLPRGAMLPEGTRFLIAAGRCASGDREANSSFRVECPCMAMGQAAGAMAALSARSGADPEALDLGEIRDLLEQHGAIVPRP